MTSTTGISMAGTLKNMLASGFSTENCITELIDDSLGAGATHVRLTLVEGPHRLIVADNGCGMTCARLREAHVLNNRSAASSLKHGRFGIGRKHALVGLTQILAPVRTLTRAADGTYSQLDVNYPQVLLTDTMELNAHEMTMSGNKDWVSHAINHEVSGTVTIIPMPVTTYAELQEALTSSDVRNSLLYALGLVYHRPLETVMLEVVVGGITKRIQSINPLAGAKKANCSLETIKIYRQRVTGEVRVYYEDGGKSCRYPVQDNRRRKIFYEDLPGEEYDHLGDVILRSAYMNNWFIVQNPILESMGLRAWDITDKKDLGIQDVRQFMGGSYYQRNGKIIQRIPAEKPESSDKDPYTIASFKNSRHTIEFTPVFSEASSDDIFTLDNIFNVQINKSKVDVGEIQKDVAFTYRKRFREFRAAICKKLAAAAPAPAPAPIIIPAPAPAPVISMPEPPAQPPAESPAQPPTVKPVVKVPRAATVAIVPVSDRRVVDDLEGFAAFLSTVDFDTLKKEASNQIRPGAAALVAAIADLIEFVND